MLAKNGEQMVGKVDKMCLLYNRLIGITIDIIFIMINWKKYFDRTILVISMTALLQAGYISNEGNLRHEMTFGRDSHTWKYLCSYMNFTPYIFGHCCTRDYMLQWDNKIVTLIQATAIWER